MTPKNIDFGEDAKQKMWLGIEKLAKAVKSTLGARGKFVAIESSKEAPFIGGQTVTKDGVTVANSVSDLDPVQDLAIRMARQAAQNTASAAGDGTTTSIVLMEAIIKAAFEHELEDSNMTEVTRHIQKMTDRIIKDLDKRAKKLTGGRLYHVATVSANNDRTLGKIVGDAYKYVGSEGVVTVSNSKGKDTYVEVIEGMRIDRGYSSRYFTNDDKRTKCVLDDAYVLISDQEIPSLKHIEGILNFVVSKGKPLMIISNMSLDASSTLAYNAANGKLKTCQVIPPSFGHRSEQMMQDLCVATGATYVSEKLGNDWDMITPDFLGRANRVVSEENRTILITDTTDDIISLVNDLNESLKTEVDLGRKEILRERISMLNGKAAVIYVGGDSDIEQKEKKDRVDDSVLATRAAMEEGILPGGGIALLNQSWLMNVESGNSDEMTATNILCSALQAPFKQILTNAGKDVQEILDEVMDEDDLGFGFDVKAEKYGDMLKLGVIDPAKVTKSALRNAVSVATTLLMTDATITNMRQVDGSDRD